MSIQRLNFDTASCAYGIDCRTLPPPFEAHTSGQCPYDGATLEHPELRTDVR